MTAEHAAHVIFRPGTQADAGAILGLVDENLAEGHLLPRTLDDLATHAHRFVVIVNQGAVVGCAELAPLSLAVAEVRSLVVDRRWRGLGLGSRLIGMLQRQARVAGFSTICAFTHEPGHFVRLGFSIAPHVWFPEKIAVDCTSCRRFRACGQRAMALALDGAVLQPPAASYTRMPIATATSSPFRLTLDRAAVAGGRR